MKTQARCDKCHELTRSWTQMRLDAEELLAIFPIEKKTEADGKVVFRFCPFCVFETAEDDANSQRVVKLIKQSLGLHGIDHAFLN